MTETNEKPKLQRIGGLFTLPSGKGDSGSVELGADLDEVKEKLYFNEDRKQWTLRVLVFKNTFKEEGSNQPDRNVYLGGKPQ